jgi:hypothetical protein
MEAKHSPGPWQAELDDSYRIRAPHGGAVATLGFLRGAFGSKGRIRHEEGIANARLIAAAPELLEACEKALEWVWDADLTVPSCVMPDESMIRMLNAAIAKAKGADHA